MNFDQIMKDVPVSGSATLYWMRQDTTLLDSAAKKIGEAGINPWLFTADENHFDQFATYADREFIRELTLDEWSALVGHWWA